MSRRSPSLRTNELGSALIEFALVSPMVIILIMAALQFGVALRANAGLRDLAGDAGREAVVSYQIQSDGVRGPAELKAYIEEHARLGRYNLRNGTLDVNVTSTPDTSLLTVNRVVVRLRYSQPIQLPFLTGKNIRFQVQRTYFVPNASPY